MIQWSVKSCQIGVGERGDVKDIPQDISARTGSCHTFPQCSVLWTIRSLVYQNVLWWKSCCVWYIPKTRPSLNSLCLQKPFAEQLLSLNLCHKLLNLVIINKQNSKEKKTTKCFRVTASVVIIENTTTAKKGAHIKYSTVKNANNER